jgi:hypothetical protein
MNDMEQQYHDDFMKYLTLPGPPKAEEVPDVPPGLSHERAKDIRWAAYIDRNRELNERRRHVK